ncbi:SRPBCC family protein [Mucilaginibacter limnophilus]|uniref:SRPBCC family protein n=1 Tax=Mucilaginibacter limnophilus TaxID=1932778 RepID=A0A3S2URD4_9SPHI|nr:SRPBCC family protein [Mucilaginibacter limnophilus]RVU02768.1 SRPBCC family protein [Mucilaginibacter limnophilus]
MTVFESIVHINKPVSGIYQFLSDLNNHQQLMPPQVQDWRSTADEASFSIQNMAKLRLGVQNRVENTEITIVPTEQPPFKVMLKWQLAQESDYTSVQFTIAAELNMMMKMLASGPLQKLADHQTQALAELFR